MLPTITRFCGDNTTEITVNGVTHYFSYNTLIGFRKGKFLYIRENEWSNTTGRHMYAIPGSDKVKRMDEQSFICAYERISK